MASRVDGVRQQQVSAEKRLRTKITIRQKRWLLSTHLLCVAAWLGGGFCSLAFNITALRATNPHLLNATYMFANTLDKTIIRGGAVGTLLTGLLLAWLAQWGLIRFYWIIVKEIAAVLCVVTGLIIRWNGHAIASTAARGLQAFSDPLYLTNRTRLFVGISFQLLMLAGVIAVSIFKPWGQRRRPSRRSVSRLSRGATPTGIVANASGARVID
jgi:hypothetical protein